MAGLSQALRDIERQRKAGKKIVFTNGCFDLIHSGHLRILKQAKKLGDVLVVALNSDASTRRLKGKSRPILPLAERAELIAGLKPVDYVVWFSEDTPYNIIRKIRPHVLIKGGDWKGGAIVGGDIVKAAGGKVVSGLFVKGRSTTDIVRKIKGA